MTSFADALSKITAFSRLPVGWDYGSGTPSTKKAISSAKSALNVLRNSGCDDFEVVPGIDGGVSLFGYRGELSVELHLTASGAYEIYDDAGDIVSTNSEAGLVAYLEGIGWQSPRLFVSCTRYATFPVSGAILVHPSETHLMEAGYLSFAPHVWPNREAVCVRTFGRIMMSESAESPRSSGEYKSLRSVKAYA